MVEETRRRRLPFRRHQRDFHPPVWRDDPTGDGPIFWNNHDQPRALSREAFTDLNAHDAQMEPTSVWHLYRSLIAARHASLLLQQGDVRFLSVLDERVIAFERRLGDQRAVIVSSWCANDTRGVSAETLAGLTECFSWGNGPAADVRATVDLAAYEVRVFASHRIDQLN